ncbi:MAG: hypothetical protein LBM71_05665 [Elusimicrobiota bacterium]|jgi:hypothetical protein|nr:hypothetical protein [Elusimicrobiota bacterium]
MSSTNIVVGVAGTGALKAAAYGEPESNGRDLGFIKGGISIEHEESSYEIKVDQFLGAIDKITTDEAMKIKFSLAEATLENIALALGGLVGENTLEFGDKTQTLPLTLYANVKGPNGLARKYTFWKCRPSGKTAQVYKRDGETLIEIEFDVLCDITKAQNKRFGKIEDLEQDLPA